MRGRTGLGLAVLAAALAWGNDLRSQETMNLAERDTCARDTLPCPGKNKRFRLTQELEYSLATSLLVCLNWKQGETGNHLDLQQSLRYQLLVTNRGSFSFSNQLDHHLGFQFFFDSISGVNTDDNSLNTLLEYKFLRVIGINFHSTLATRLLKGFDYFTDSTGSLVRVINSSFLTPLIWTFSLGLGFTLKNTGSLTLEISSAKLTYLRDVSVFRIRNTGQFYGVPEGKNHIFEYGLGLRVLIDTRLFKKIDWQSDIRIFKEYHSPADLTVSNEFAIRFWKFLKLGMRTLILYENKVSKRVQVENLVSFGFCFKV